MSIQHFGKGALRVAKNYTKGYSDVQAKVREATSNDAWGPSGTQMNEIAQMSFNQNDFVEIMEMLDKRLNDKGKNWRHVFKSLTVLDYLLHAGSENVVIYFKDNIYIIKTLKEFQYIDEYGKDQGANVRQKAKDITNLLQDDSRLRHERRSRAHMRDRMLGDDGPPGHPSFDENHSRRSPDEVHPPPRPQDQTDDELRRAIEASKRTLAEEQARGAEDRDLAQAIRLSEEEEARRNQAVLDANGQALFDDQQQLNNNSNNNLLIDTQPFGSGLQPQFTSVQPQFTSFNPYQQQAQQEAAQAEYLRQQQEWLRQQQEQQAQAQAQAQLQAQQEEWLRQQQLLQFQQQQAQQFQQQQQQQQQQFQQFQQPLAPQQTSFGTNNPFAQAPSFPSAPSPSTSSAPSNALSNFSLPSTYETHSPSTNLSSVSVSSNSPRPSASPQPPRGPTRTDQEHSQLASLFAGRADGEGVDTFGNVGQLRYAATDAGRLVAQKTGAQHSNFNPFAHEQQQQQQRQQQNPEQPFFSI